MKKIKYSLIFLSLCSYNFYSKASQMHQKKNYTTPEPYLTPESSDEEIVDFGQQVIKITPSAPKRTQKKELKRKMVKIAWAETKINPDSDSDLSDPDEKKLTRPQKNKSNLLSQGSKSDCQLIDSDAK